MNSNKWTGHPYAIANNSLVGQKQNAALQQKWSTAGLEIVEMKVSAYLLHGQLHCYILNFLTGNICGDSANLAAKVLM